ncbi:MAG TPA: hypothetical protein VGH11_10460 [Jatrophihabitans sp.]|jgi:transcriptional regulator with XRE-family HTH domain
MTAAAEQGWSSRQLVVTQRVRNRRSELGLTQKQVVTRLARYGVRTTNRALSSLEHGVGIDVAKLPELAAALDCTVSYLLGLTTDPHRWEPDVSTAPSAGSTTALSAPSAARAAESSRQSTDVQQAASLILGTEVPDRDLGLAGRPVWR